mmetsp:Transcript_19710/g.50076  ORF Transcript_19710/g.50076 Transcript_19710/m.50076 type:complete len:222 (-) Transcript_19710:41-706(-)
MRAWISGPTRSSQSCSPASPEASATGPGLSPSSSYSVPPTGTYAMKWNASSSLPPFWSSSGTSGSGRAKLLCTPRMTSLLLMARPLMSGGMSDVKALKSVSASPSSTPGAPGGMLSRMERMAWVAHALGITWFAKNTVPVVSSAVGRLSSSATHLNRKMRPYTGLICSRVSLSMLHSSSTCTPFTPIFSISSVNTPGSDSIVVHDPSPRPILIWAVIKLCL